MSGVSSVAPVRKAPHVEFCGIDTPLSRTPFAIGRDGDLIVDDDNRYLHRHFLSVDYARGLWTLANIGTQISAAVLDSGGRVETHLAPGGVVALVSAATTVRFAAGPTTYELTIHVPGLAFAAPGPAGRRDDDGCGGADATIGRVELSPEQLLVILVLAEPVLRSGHFVAAALPANADAADRLGWTLTKFNRKLDTVCAKLADRGVRNLRGGPIRLATNRRARLVEYAIAARLVTHADLPLLPAGHRPAGAPARFGNWASTGGWVRSR